MCSNLEYYALAHNDLYVSRHYGNDSYNCGSREEPCRTLARGLQIANRNDRILLDGSFTKSDPYNCEETVNLEKKGKTKFLKDEYHTINVKVSLQIIGFPSPAFISCDDLLRFTGPSSKKEEMDVNFTSIVFTKTSMLFIDSSVSFVHCIFLQSYNPIQTKLVFQQSATVAVKGSLFYNNTGCIRLALFKSNTRAAIHLENVNFTQNRLFSANEGCGISIYGASRTFMLNIGINVSCKNVLFSNNVAPLITNNVTFSETKEFYQRVKFVRNSVPMNASSAKGLYFSRGRNVTIFFDHVVSTGNVANIRCVQFDSRAVQLKVFNSQINSHSLAEPHSGAGIFIQAVRSSHVFIKNSSFNGNTAAYRGGAVAFNVNGGVVNVTVCKTNFTNNSALDGGAFSVNSQLGFVVVDLEHVSFRNCRSNRSGGALFIKRHIHVQFRARFCLWMSCSAQLGSSIYINSFSDVTESNTITKLKNCKFANNSDLLNGSVFVLSSVGSVEVFQTEWNQNSRAFAMACNCRVNFTKVNITGCNRTAFHGLSSASNRDNMKLHFERCLFRANKKGDIYVFAGSRFLQLTLESIKFLEKWSVKKEYNAVLIKLNETGTFGSKIEIYNVLIEEFVGSAAVIVKSLNSNATNTVTIKNSTFRKIRSYYSEKYHTETSPLSIVFPVDDLGPSICSRSYLSHHYRNTIIIENSSFVDNIGRVSGGVYLVNGNVTIRSCTFENNFAIDRGGHVHISDGSGSVRIENSTFKQRSQEMIFTGETFVHDTSIYSQSTGQLLLQRTWVTTDFEKDSYRLFSVSKSGLVNLDNSTKLQCAVGSLLRLDNFSHFILWPSGKEPCKLKVTVITLSCHQCSPGQYSLQRGEITAPLQKRVDSLFNPFCFPCPDGANCSRNIEAKPNFWGYPDSNNSGTLKFVHCPPHYCKPIKRRGTNLSVYNSCRGNRDGVMCGRCMEGYSETLFSKKCKPSEKCRDPWIWLLMTVYTVAMALFFIHNPPIIQFLVENTLWYKRSRNRMQYQEIDRSNKFNKGYTKITFYFYQIASYLTLESFTELAKQAPLISFITGLFNFQTRVSRGNFGCPFPGLTVVTKELLPALGVLATLFNIQVILLMHLCFNKITGRPRPTMASYYAATLKTLLLGYATLANTALKLLSCVQVLGESRLYYDANIKCLEWWQYVFIIYVAACLLPFIAVIYWGAMKLQRQLISVEHFIGACFFPLGFVSWWLIQKVVSSRNRRRVTSESSAVVLKVLHDPFRPPSPHQTGSLYWESVMIGRRFLLLSFQVFFPDPLLRLFFMDMTCLLVFTWRVVTRPFRDQKANILEAVSLACLVVIATINLIQAIFLSAGVTPQGSVERNLIVLQQVEICLLAIAPLLLVFLCGFAVASQVTRAVVIVFRKTVRFVLMRRIQVMGQY